jgi:hypothetical protein
LGILDQALAAMFEVLDRYTLSEAVAEPSGQVIVMLNRIGMKQLVAVQQK